MNAGIPTQKERQVLKVSIKGTTTRVEVDMKELSTLLQSADFLPAIGKVLLGAGLAEKIMGFVRNQT